MSMLKRSRRVSAVLTGAGALAGALTLGLAGSASASSVPAWQVQVCSKGSFQTNAYFAGTALNVPAGQCKTAYFQPTSSSSYVVTATVYVSGGTYIASANIDIAQGAGLATTGSASSPSMYSF
ncbi:hypothetical protein [Streptomyces sp. NPDC057694]|uniref:hypothetical protein n=1 Tax=Streptomyces sp. NPDC057694 TaxID=3346216 RepID=UPI00369C5D55